MQRFLPVMWFGFWLNAISGVLLLIGYPTKALTNPVFYLKLLFIALAVTSAIGRFVPKGSKLWASLSSWPVGPSHHRRTPPGVHIYARPTAAGV